MKFLSLVVAQGLVMTAAGCHGQQAISSPCLEEPAASSAASCPPAWRTATASSSPIRARKLPPAHRPPATGPSLRSSVTRSGA